MDGLEIETNSKLGRIVAVAGSQAIVLLENQKPTPSRSERPGQLGTLVRMPTAISVVFGIISALDIPLPAQEPDQGELEMAEIELVGEIVERAGEGRHFRRGISIFPALGESVFVATPNDLALVYASPSAAAARIGTVHQDRSLPAFILTDELLGKHFAVLGSTGTGKSCAVALILRTVLAHNQKGHVLLLDVHNEYAPAFRDMAEILDAGSFELPYWLLTFDEFEEILLNGVSNRAIVGAILGDLVLNAKRLFADNSGRAQAVSLDTPVPYRLSDIDRLIDTTAGSLNKGADPAPYLTLKARLAAVRSDPRYGFMFPRLVVADNMETILSRLFRVPTNGKPVSIVDLSTVPSEILGVVVAVLSRMSFQSRSGASNPYPSCWSARRRTATAPRRPDRPSSSPGARSRASRKKAESTACRSAWSASGPPKYRPACSPSATRSSRSASTILRTRRRCAGRSVSPRWACSNSCRP